MPCASVSANRTVTSSANPPSDIGGTVGLRPGDLPSFDHQKGCRRAIRENRRSPRAARAAHQRARGTARRGRTASAAGGSSARAGGAGAAQPAAAVASEQGRTRPRGAPRRSPSRLGRRPRHPPRDRLLRRDGGAERLDRRADPRRPRVLRIRCARRPGALSLRHAGSDAGGARRSRRRPCGALRIRRRRDSPLRPDRSRRRPGLRRRRRRAGDGDRRPLGDEARRRDPEPRRDRLAPPPPRRDAGGDARVHGDRARRGGRRAPLAALGLARRRRGRPERAAAGRLARRQLRGAARASPRRGSRYWSERDRRGARARRSGARRRLVGRGRRARLGRVRDARAAGDDRRRRLPRPGRRPHPRDRGGAGLALPRGRPARRGRGRADRLRRCRVRLGEIRARELAPPERGHRPESGDRNRRSRRDRLPRIGRDRRPDSRVGRGGGARADPASPAERLLGAARLRLAPVRTPPQRAAAQAGRLRAPGGGDREGLYLRPLDAGVDLPRALVHRARASPARGCLRVPAHPRPHRGRHRMKLALFLAAGLLAAPAALRERDFRWERQLEATGGGLVTFRPDGPLFAHTKPGQADLRVEDAGGRQVPWRPLPDPAPRSSKDVELLNAGVQGRAFVALLDLGPQRVVRNRAELVIQSDRNYVGRVTVEGSDDRQSFTRLSTTTVFDLQGAAPAVSTTLVFPPTDHRFLRLRGIGVPLPVSARVYSAPRRPELERVQARASTEQQQRQTHVRLDVRYPGLPVDRLRFRSTTRRFDRPVVVSGSNGSRTFRLVARGRIVRLGGVAQLELPVRSDFKLISVVVENGDDAPLDGLRVEALARPRTIVLAQGFQAPYRLLYGNRTLDAPEYDFASVPTRELRPLAVGRLGPERANAAFEPPADMRSFLERNGWLVDGALALVAVALGGGGVFSLRRRAFRRPPRGAF